MKFFWDDGEEVVVEDEVLRVYEVQQKFVYDVTTFI